MIACHSGRRKLDDLERTGENTLPVNTRQKNAIVCLLVTPRVPVFPDMEESHPIRHAPKELYKTVFNIYNCFNITQFKNIKINKSVAYSSQGSHTGPLDWKM